MPKIENILKTMNEQKIPEDIIKQLPLPKTKKAKPSDIVNFINSMDNLLSKEQVLSIMEEQGCYKVDWITRPFRKFGEAHAEKPIEEKIKLWDELETKHKIQCALNSDGTLTFRMNGNGGCPCSTANKLRPNIPLSYCGCCGGHIRYTHQYALGVNLRLKKIVSSFINSDGKKPCEFHFEIIEEII